MTTELSALRWTCKKLARKTVSRISRSFGLIDSKNNSEPCVRVLTYHRFGNNFRDPFCIFPTEFERQMEFLATSELAIDLGEFESFVGGEKKLNRPRVLVTIDDGHTSTSSIALPILERYGIPSVAFVSPELIGEDADSLDVPESYMTWDEVSKTSSSLMKIGAHSLTHVSYGSLSPKQIVADATRSRGLLEAHLPYTVQSLAYPFGTRADYSDEIATLVSDCGFTTAFTSQHGPVLAATNMLTIPRIKVENGDTVDDLLYMIRGSMDAWRHVDRFLWRLQANR